MLHIPAAVAGAFIAIALTLSGCGESDSGANDGPSSLSADALYKKAQKELDAAPAFTVSGDFGEGTSQTQLDMTYESTGDAYGTIVIDGARGEMRSIDGQYFVRGTDEYWKVAGRGAGQSPFLIAAIRRATNDKWISFGPPPEDNAIIDRDRMLQLVEAADGVSKGKRRTIDGVDCLALESEQFTIFVDAKSGRPVRLDYDDGEPIDFAYTVGTSPGAPDGAIDVKGIGP